MWACGREEEREIELCVRERIVIEDKHCILESLSSISLWIVASTTQALVRVWMKVPGLKVRTSFGLYCSCIVTYGGAVFTGGTETHTESVSAVKIFPKKFLSLKNRS